MSYKLTPKHRAAVMEADATLDAAELPAYSEVLALLLELAENSAQREAFKTVANCKRMVDLHTEIRKKLAPFNLGLQRDLDRLKEAKS